MRRLFLVSYDISISAKRLRKVYKLLRGYGDHLQFSVFLCELSLKEKAELSDRLLTIIKQTEDQVLFVDLGPLMTLNRQRIKALGIPFTCTERHCTVV